MNIQTPVIADSEVKITADQYARKLGVLLLNTPEYQAYINALKIVNNDPDVLKISAELRSHRNALRWSPADTAVHEAALFRLETELEALPVLQEYGLAEKSICRIFADVDAIISQEADVLFSANATRSGCGCGG